MWFRPKAPKRNEKPGKLDFFVIEELYAEGRDLFLQGKHEEAMDCFKRTYEETLDFRDVCEFVDDYCTGEKDLWGKNNNPDLRNRSGKAAWTHGENSHNFPTEEKR